jgi:hypothetical protein
MSRIRRQTYDVLSRAEIHADKVRGPRREVK